MIMQVIEDYKWKNFLIQLEKKYIKEVFTHEICSSYIPFLHSSP